MGTPMESHDPCPVSRPMPSQAQEPLTEEKPRSPGATDHEAPWQVDTVISTSPSPERPIAIFLSNILKKTHYSVL